MGVGVSGAWMDVRVDDRKIVSVAARIGFSKKTTVAQGVGCQQSSLMVMDRVCGGYLYLFV